MNRMNAEERKTSKKAYRRKYRLSKKGKTTEKAWNKSAKGKAARKKASKSYRAKSPAKDKARRRRHRLKKAFGITIEQYDEMFKKQGGCCAICGDTNIKYGRRLAVDHHHKTKKVRGLLCNQCNRALGYFQDDINNLASAIKYLSGGT